MPYATSSLYKTFFGGSSQGSQGFSGGGKKTQELIKLLYSKKEFLIYVFSNLIVQLGITYYFMMNYNVEINLMTQLILFFIQFNIIFILAFIPMPSWLKFILFSVFSLTFGLLLSSVKKSVDFTIIKTALVGTIGIFGSMAMVGLGLIFFGIELSKKIGLYLLLLLLLLIITSIVLMIMNKYQTYNKLLAIIGLFLFSLYIVYDTNKILQRSYDGDFITASLDYYLDILNIFVNLIDLNNS